MRRPGANYVVLVAGVERQSEPLALLDCQRVRIALIRVVCGGAILGVRAGEQQQVGDVLVAACALLRQVVGPSQHFQYRDDQLLLGCRFVGAAIRVEGVVALPDAVAERLRVGGG